MGMTPVDIREADWDAYALMGFEDLDLRSSNEKRRGRALGRLDG